MTNPNLHAQAGMCLAYQSLACFALREAADTNSGEARALAFDLAQEAQDRIASLPEEAQGLAQEAVQAQLNALHVSPMGPFVGRAKEGA